MSLRITTFYSWIVLSGFWIGIQCTLPTTINLNDCLDALLQADTNNDTILMPSEFSSFLTTFVVEDTTTNCTTDPEKLDSIFWSVACNCTETDCCGGANDSQINMTNESMLNRICSQVNTALGSAICYSNTTTSTTVQDSNNSLQGPSPGKEQNSSVSSDPWEIDFDQNQLAWNIMMSLFGGLACLALMICFIRLGREKEMTIPVTST